MPDVRFERVLSFSSEDPPYKAENLLGWNPSNRRWRCEKVGEARLSAVFQTKSPVRITSLDIGNWGSAFVEVLVKRQESDDDFHVLLPGASFLSPLESRNEQSLTRVRMFGSDKVSTQISSQKWDQVKVVCTQPFNRRMKYGLSFFTAHSAPEVTKMGAFTLKGEEEEGENPVVGGSLFARKKEADRGSPSVVAEMKSEATLAAMALKGMASNPNDPGFSAKANKRKAAETEPNFYQLKRAKQEDKQLPRRDVVPRAEIEPRRKSFDKLMVGVKFVLSGFKNPLRGEIREKAVRMGAKYSGDWDSACTHLVSAFLGTPKFNQVRSCGRASKIVKKEWVEDGHRDRKRYPWRRYCLDPKDSKKVESEDEVWEEVPIVGSEAAADNSAGEETDEEIEKIKAEKLQNGSARVEADSSIPSGASNINGAAEETIEEVSLDDDDDDDDVEAYKVETDVDEENEDPPFKGSRFFLYGVFIEGVDRRALKEQIERLGGAVESFMNPKVDFIVTHESVDRNFGQAREENRQVRFVKPEFVSDCCSGRTTFESISRYLIEEFP